MQKKEREIRVYTSRSNTAFPCIILQGKWLADIGFVAGDYLSIKCQNKKITIEHKQDQEN